MVFFLSEQTNSPESGKQTSAASAQVTPTTTGQISHQNASRRLILAERTSSPIESGSTMPTKSSTLPASIRDSNSNSVSKSNTFSAADSKKIIKKGTNYYLYYLIIYS